MKTLIYTILLGFACLGFTSCGDDGEERFVTPYEKQYGEAAVMWDATHQSLFNFKGNPFMVRVSEASTDVDGNIDILNTTKKYIFDAQGHLLEYDPWGDLADGYSVFSGQWGAVGDATKYSYEYDSDGRIIKVIEAELGAEPVTYTIHYGVHSTYVPSPFPLGNLSFFLLKGLERVEGDNGFRYEYDGEKAFCEVDTWMGVTRTEYVFRGGYPFRCVRLLIRAENILRKEETVYAFGDKGVLLGTTTTITTDDEDTVQKQTLVYASPWLEVKKMICEIGLTREEYVYDYTENGFLVSATKNDSEGRLVSVSLRSDEYDAYGNRIYAERVVDGYFNDYWAGGTMIQKRDFSYK